MTATVPPAHPRQRQQALKKANAVRAARAQLKADVLSGDLSVEAILLNPPDFISSMRIFDLLLCVPKLGRVKSRILLSRIRISGVRPVGELTLRERREISRMVAR